MRSREERVEMSFDQCHRYVLGWSPCLGALGVPAAGDQHGERIAGLARADADLDVVEPGAPSASAAARRRRSRAARSPSFARDPFFLVRAQVEHQHAAAGRGDARAPRRPRAPGLTRVVQRLRQHRDVHRRVLHRQLLELALLPDDVRRRGAAARARWRASSTHPDRSTAMTRDAQRAASIVR